MSYYNQLNYKNVPYPHAAHPAATVATSGCGVCCMSMVVEGLTGKKWGPKESAAYSISIGARASGGTDVAKLGREAAKKFGLVYSTTSDVNKLVEKIKGGAWAIANVGGDRSGYVGLFSDAGHYIVVKGIAAGRFTIWDPMMYANKFNQAGRAGKVTVAGNDIYCIPAFLDQDCSNRSPRYYIFEEEPMTQEEFNKMMDKWLESRAQLPESDWSKSEGAWARFTKKKIVNGENPRSFPTREEMIAVLDRLGLGK